jgi:hypothetical protein
VLQIELAACVYMASQVYCENIYLPVEVNPKTQDYFKMSEDTETSGENRIFVQLRLPAELGEALREAGARANRKLPAEIIYRLQQGPSAAPVDAQVYGWINPERDKALADAIGVLASRIEEAAAADDTAQDTARVLAMFKVAIANLLDHLGANEKELSSFDRRFAEIEAYKMANEMRRPDPGPNSIGSRPDLEIIAKLAKAWEPVSARKDGGG